MLRLESQPIGLLGCYEILEEAVKSWHYVITDKVVYLNQLIVGNDDPFANVTELDTDLDRWLEINLTFGGYRETRFTAILRPAYNGHHVGWTNNVHLARYPVVRNPTMFVDVPQSVQTPQFRSFVSIPTVVWLKRIDNAEGCGGIPLTAWLKIFRLLEFITPMTGKLALSLGVPPWRASVCKRGDPSEVIQGTSQTRDKIANNEPKPCIVYPNVETKDVLSSFKIILSRDRVSVAFQKLPHLIIKSAEVMLRPTNLQTGAKMSGP